MMVVPVRMKAKGRLHRCSYSHPTWLYMRIQDSLPELVTVPSITQDVFVINTHKLAFELLDKRANTSDLVVDSEVIRGNQAFFISRRFVSACLLTRHSLSNTRTIGICFCHHALPHMRAQAC
ncbi:hypothetical protein SERLA73DRAFT_190305 [Serpula lacrymans var. lacrymans S7.3]|uniref:Uncharacterized protein n=2 Tax=Serpula lacrymans var. lacrymans TaxID=341189 RepID=F8QFE9_SERL3|nr:uncharacterized protein SERLADRAFT_479327 [Serpula lacrymans var. lacrymans S7.9]EGN92933.1 hypothetical protein SERLA73DRAFT_190305 [Serpula lacrymans var. lacrymans S7.3]EGO19654.1 hypothetical protein SERLADRAFT_479327 [Serpula lacrymans var. lacrymans S7.9]